MSKIESVSSQMHLINVEIAIKYGIESAAFLTNLCFWLCQNIANKKNYRDGRYWTYNSQEAYTKVLPYFSKKQIEYLIIKLKKIGVLFVSNYNEKLFDRTCWYSVSDEILSMYLGKEYISCPDEPPKSVEQPLPVDPNESNPAENEREEEKENEAISKNSDIDILKFGNGYPKIRETSSENSDIETRKSGNPSPKSAAPIPYLKPSSKLHFKQNSSSPVDFEEEKEKFANLFVTVCADLIFSADFYPAAFNFMKDNSLSSEYIQWVYEDLKSKNPRSLSGLFYKLFLKQETLQRFIIQNKLAAKKVRECPVCGFIFELKADTYCPRCEFNCIDPPSALPEVEKYNLTIAKYKKIWLLPDAARKAYKNDLEKILLQNFGSLNFDSADSLSELDKKYGLLKIEEVMSGG